MVQLVCFHLQNENPEFEKTLRNLGNWSNRIPGSWILETQLTPRQVRDILGAHMKPGDRLFVARIAGDWAGRGMGEGFPEWMQRRKGFAPVR